jgi:hypothetical protein
MGKRKFMWSVPVRALYDMAHHGSLYIVNHQLYLGCRWCTLVNLVMNLTNLNMSTVINCQVRSL